MKSVKRIQWAIKSIFLTFSLVLLLASGLYAEIYQSSSQSSETPPSPPQGAKGAQDQQGQQGKMSPPQAAIDVCSGKTEGDACQCQGPRGNESGTCEYTPDKKYFACKPSRNDKPQNDKGQQQPPKPPEN